MTSRSGRWGRSGSSSQLELPGLLGWADFTGGHLDDKVENATEVWLYYRLISSQTPTCADKVPFSKIATNVIEHHYTKHTANIAQSGIWCVWVPIPHPDTLSLEQWMVCISVDVPQIWFKSVSFEWGEEIGNNKQQKRTWAWRCCTVHPGESVDSRLSLIWMRQTSNKTKEKKKGKQLIMASPLPLKHLWCNF